MVALLSAHLRIREIIRVLVDLRVCAVQGYWLQHVLCELVLLSIDGVVPLVQEEIVILSLLLLLAECLEVLLAFLHAYQVKGCRHLLRDLRTLDLTHSLAHLFLIWI